MVVTMMLSGLSFLTVEKAEIPWLDSIGKWIALMLMVVFLFSYSAGMASIPWLINSEIYPLFLIASASALSAFTNWMTSFAMTSIFEKTHYVVSIEAAAVCNLITYFFVRYFVKETRGNSITKNVALMLNKTQREVIQFVQETQKISSPLMSKKTSRQPSETSNSVIITSETVSQN